MDPEIELEQPMTDRPHAVPKLRLCKCAL